MKIKINALDVWGNTDDGYEVNDVLGCQGVIEIDKSEPSDKDIIQALIDQDVIYPGEYALDDMSDTFLFCNLIDPKDGRPILQLMEMEE